MYNKPNYNVHNMTMHNYNYVHNIIKIIILLNILFLTFFI